MWNHGCRPPQHANYCPCGCCSKNDRNRPSNVQNSLYVLTPAYQEAMNPNPAQIPCQPAGFNEACCCGGGIIGGGKLSKEYHPQRDMGSLMDNVPSNSQAARCIEKLQHLVLVKVTDPSVSLKCLQDLFMLKKVLVDDCKKKGEKNGKKKPEENTQSNVVGLSDVSVKASLTASSNPKQDLDERRSILSSQEPYSYGGEEYGRQEDDVLDRKESERSGNDKSETIPGPSASSTSSQRPPSKASARGIRNPIVNRVNVENVTVTDERLTRKLGYHSLDLGSGQGQSDGEGMNPAGDLKDVLRGPRLGSAVNELDNGLIDWLNKINQNSWPENVGRRHKRAAKFESEVRINLKGSDAKKKT